MGDKEFKIDLVTLKAAIDIAMTLIESGTNIYKSLKAGDLTVEKLDELLDDVNARQVESKAKLKALIEQKKNEVE